MSTDSFCCAVKSAHIVFQQAEAIGFKFSLLDLGGGWPGTDDEITFSSIVSAINPLLEQLFPPEIRIIAEPGRYFVTESHTLAVNIFAKRTIIDEKPTSLSNNNNNNNNNNDNNDNNNSSSDSTSEKSFLYYVNDGVYQSFNCILFDHYVPKPLVFNTTEMQQRPKFKSTVWGQTCDGLDSIVVGILLPEMKVGEWLYFKNMGAYTIAASSAFNGFKSPTCYFVQTPL